jgi:hypothetical protein
VDGVNMSNPWILESVYRTPLFQVGIDSPESDWNPARVHEVLSEIDIPIRVLGEGAIHDTIAFDLEEWDGRAHRVGLEAKDLFTSNTK